MKRICLVVLLITVFVLVLTVAAAAEGQTYADKVSGVSFSVPAGWDEVPMDIQYVQVGYRYEGNLDSGIAFVYLDAWELVEDKVDVLLDREDLSNDVYDRWGFLIERGLLSDFGLEPGMVEEAYYGGMHYFLIDVSGLTNADAQGLTEMVAVRLENGYLYMFSLIGEDVDEYMADFESVLESVRYGGESAAAQEQSSRGADSEEQSSRVDESAEEKTEKEKNAVERVLVFVCAVLFLAVIALVLVLVRRARGERPRDDRRVRESRQDYGYEAASYTMPGLDYDRTASSYRTLFGESSGHAAQPQTPPAPQPAPAPVPQRYWCPQCGYEIRRGDPCCSKCGQAIAWMAE